MTCPIESSSFLAGITTLTRNIIITPIIIFHYILQSISKLIYLNFIS